MATSPQQFFQAARSGDLKFFMEHQGDITSSRDDDGDTILIAAAKANQEEVVRFLCHLENPRLVGMKDKDGNTALLAQIELGYGGTDVLLEQEYAEVDSESRTPYHVAALRDNVQAARRLNPELRMLKDMSGNLPIEVAIRNASHEVLKYMIANPGPDLEYALAQDYLETSPTFQMLLGPREPPIDQRPTDLLGLARATSASTHAAQSDVILPRTSSPMGVSGCSDAHLTTCSADRDSLDITRALLTDDVSREANDNDPYQMLGPPGFEDNTPFPGTIPCPPKNLPSRSAVASQSSQLMDPTHSVVVEDNCRDTHRCCQRICLFQEAQQELELDNARLRNDNSDLQEKMFRISKEVLSMRTELQNAQEENLALRCKLEELQNKMVFTSSVVEPDLTGSVIASGLERAGSSGQQSMVKKLSECFTRIRRLERERFELEQKLNDRDSEIRKLQRDNDLKRQLNSMLSEDNRRSRDQSRHASLLLSSVMSPGHSMMNSVIEGSIHESMMAQQRTEGSRLRRKVAELRALVQTMTDDIARISKLAVDLLPTSCSGGVHVANLRTRAEMARNGEDDPRVMFRRYADLTIDCLTYLESQNEERPQASSPKRSASNRTLFGVLVAKLGFKVGSSS